MSPTLTAHTCSAVLPDQQALMSHATAMARRIASHSPVAIAGTKANLNWSRDHASVSDGLEFAAVWNAAMLQVSWFVMAPSRANILQRS